MKYLWLFALATALSGCAGTPWQQPGKTEKQRDQDLAKCERDAEAQALAQRGATRGDYGLATRGPDAALDSRGLSPLQLKDKSELANDFDALVGRCMKAKGYAQGDAAKTKRRN